MEIHCFLVRRRIRVAAEAVDEIQFETVQPPAAGGLLISGNQITAHLRVSGIQNTGMQDRIVMQKHILKGIPHGGIFPHERNTVPDHTFHTQIVNVADVAGKVRELFRGRLPVPAEAISPVIIGGLPSVVYDNRLHSHFGGLPVFVQEKLIVHFLVIRIPGGIHGKTGAVRNFHGRIRQDGIPPGGGILQDFVKRQGAEVKTDLQLSGRYRFGKVYDNMKVDLSVFFVHPG